MKNLLVIIVVLTASLLLANCGPSQTELDADAARVTANLAEAQTTEPPTTTPTPVPPTATPIPPMATFTPKLPTATPTADLETTAAAAETAQRAEGLLAQGIENIEAQDYEQAVENLSEVIALEPDHAEAYRVLGVVYGNQGDLEQALQNFDKAIELDPDFAVAYLWRGYTHADSGNRAQAISDLEYYLEFAPNAPNREEVISLVEALKVGDLSTTPVDWLVTAEELNAFSQDIGILQWELQEELPGQSRVCRMFSGVSWSANPNIGMNCVNLVEPDSTIESIVQSLYEQQILYSTDIALKPFSKDGKSALYAHVADNGQSIYDAFLIGDGLLFRASVGVGTPAGYTPETLFEEQGEVIEAFLNDILRINLERSGQSAILDN